MITLASTLSSVAPSQRIRGVDIARGLALLGILLVNVRFFFWPLAVAIDPTLEIDGVATTDADRIAWSVVETLCTFKCISLFSLLFGFGIATQVDRVLRAGGNCWAFGARRCGVLLAIGLVHGLFVWYGDILTLYALLGFAVFAMARVSLKALRFVIVTLISVLVVLTVLGASLQWAARVYPEVFAFQPTDVVLVQSFDEAADTSEDSEIASDAPIANIATTTTPLRGFDAIYEAGGDISSEVWREAETAAFREGPFIDALLFRWSEFVMSLIAGLFGYGWHALIMMLIGVYVFRTGLFSAETRARRMGVGIGCTIVGLGLSILAVAPLWIMGLESPFALAMHAVFLELGALVLPLGYAMLIVEYGPRWPAAISIPIERAGRMALSLYLTESLICTTLASWWGFALFGSMLDLRLSLIAIAVWISLLLMATLWLQRFRIGPMEWLWRRLSYGRTPARTQAASSIH